MVLCLAMPIAVSAGDNGYKVTYDGGSVHDVKAGTDLKLFIDPDQIRLVEQNSRDHFGVVDYGDQLWAGCPSAGGSSHWPCVVSLGIGALMALTKSKKHFIGLTWTDGDKKGGFAMQCDKNLFCGVLAGLEGITGKKAVISDAMTVKN